MFDFISCILVQFLTCLLCSGDASSLKCVVDDEGELPSQKRACGSSMLVDTTRANIAISPRPMTFEWVGLSNEGQTCYINCCLQLLYTNSLFREATSLASDPTNTSMCILLSRIFDEMTSSSTIVNPSALRKHLNLRGDRSADVVEFLARLLNTTSTCITTSSRANGEGIDVLRNIGMAQSICGSGRIMVTTRVLRRDGQYQRVIATRVNTESFVVLPHALHASRRLATGLGHEFGATERLFGVNRVSHEGCLYDGERRCEFVRESLPPVLFVHLQRFSRGLANAYIKDSDPYDIPSMLDLTPFCTSNRMCASVSQETMSTLYTLSAIVMHRGDMDGGHNWIYARVSTNTSCIATQAPNQPTSTWLEFDDRIVTPISEANVLRSACVGAYLLVYHRSDKVRDCLSPPSKPLVTRYVEDDLVTVRVPNPFDDGRHVTREGRIMPSKDEDASYRIHVLPRHAGDGEVWDCVVTSMCILEHLGSIK